MCCLRLLTRPTEGDFYSLYQTRRISRAEPNNHWLTTGAPLCAGRCGILIISRTPFDDGDGDMLW